MKTYENLQFNCGNHHGPSWNYFSRAKEFNVRCTIVNRDMGAYVDKYNLSIEGEPFDIQSFMSYLRHVGFNIKRN